MLLILFYPKIDNKNKTGCVNRCPTGHLPDDCNYRARLAKGSTYPVTAKSASCGGVSGMR